MVFRMKHAARVERMGVARRCGSGPRNIARGRVRCRAEAKPNDYVMSGWVRLDGIARAQEDRSVNGRNQFGASSSAPQNETDAPTFVVRSLDERAAVDRLARTISEIGETIHASLDARARVLQAVMDVAGHVDLSRTPAGIDTYGRRVLREESSGWSLAAVTLRHGQATEAHDHNGWGCAVTVQGVERDRRFTLDETGNLMLISEQDYPAGAGYLFTMQDIHQPIGADPEQETVALHFLFLDHASGANHQHLHEGRAHEDELDELTAS